MTTRPKITREAWVVMLRAFNENLPFAKDIDFMPDDFGIEVAEDGVVVPREPTQKILETMAVELFSDDWRDSERAVLRECRAVYRVMLAAAQKVKGGIDNGQK